MTNKRREEIRVKLNDIFCDVFDDDTINIFEEMTSNDLDEWDSLMHITLIVNIEQEFNIQLDAAEIGNLENVGKMLTLLDERSQ